MNIFHTLPFCYMFSQIQCEAIVTESLFFCVRYLLHTQQVIFASYCVGCVLSVKTIYSYGENYLLMEFFGFTPTGELCFELQSVLNFNNNHCIRKGLKVHHSFVLNKREMFHSTLDSNEMSL